MRAPAAALVGLLAVSLGGCLAVSLGGCRATPPAGSVGTRWIGGEGGRRIEITLRAPRADTAELIVVGQGGGAVPAVLAVPRDVGDAFRITLEPSSLELGHDAWIVFGRAEALSAALEAFGLELTAEAQAAAARGGAPSAAAALARATRGVAVGVMAVPPVSEAPPGAAGG